MEISYEVASDQILSALHAEKWEDARIFLGQFYQQHLSALPNDATDAKYLVRVANALQEYDTDLMAHGQSGANHDLLYVALRDGWELIRRTVDEERRLALECINDAIIKINEADDYTSHMNHETRFKELRIHVVGARDELVRLRERLVFNAGENVLKIPDLSRPKKGAQAHQEQPKQLQTIINSLSLALNDLRNNQQRTSRPLTPSIEAKMEIAARQILEMVKQNQ